MSFGKKLRRVVKKVGRVHAKVFAKTVKIAAPLLSAAATVFVGPAGGLAVTGALAGASTYAGATAARANGLKGRAARQKGRSLRKQVLKYGLLGTGLGAAAGAIAGGSLLTGLAGAATTATKALPTSAGQAVLGSGLTPGDGSDISGFVTGLPGAALPKTGDPTSPPGSSDFVTNVGDVIGKLGTAYLGAQGAQQTDKGGLGGKAPGAGNDGGSLSDLLGGIVGNPEKGEPPNYVLLGGIAVLAFLLVSKK